MNLNYLSEDETVQVVSPMDYYKKKANATNLSRQIVLFDVYN